MKLQDKIIKLRKENGWSQEELAEKLNVSRQAISRWENGSALPDAQNVLQISKLFNVTTDYLLNDDYESDNDIPVVQTANNETEMIFIKKKKTSLIAAIAFIVAAICWLISAIINFMNADGISGMAYQVLSCFAFGLCVINAILQFCLYRGKLKTR